MEDLIKLWANLTEYARKAMEYLALGATKLWTLIGEYLGAVVERAQGLSAEQLRFVAALACGALLVVFLLWANTLRKLRRAREELAEAEARNEALQAKYDAEVKWRTAAERVKDTRATRAALAPSPLPDTPHQAAGTVASALGAPRGAANVADGVTAPAHTSRIMPSRPGPLPGAVGGAQDPSTAAPDHGERV